MKFLGVFLVYLSSSVVCNLGNSFFKSSRKYLALAGYANRTYFTKNSAKNNTTCGLREFVASGSVLAVMDLDMLSKMKVDELKNFLRLRGLKVSGRKEELVARAFVGIENNVQIVQTAEEVEAVIRKQYLAKLSVALSDKDTEEIPDPF